MNTDQRRQMLAQMANKSANVVIEELVSEGLELDDKRQAAIKAKKNLTLSKIDDEERESYIAEREEAVLLIFERMGPLAKNNCKGCGGKGHFLQINPGLTEGEVAICACIMKSPKGRDLLRELHEIVQPSKGDEDDDNL